MTSYFAACFVFGALKQKGQLISKVGVELRALKVHYVAFTDLHADSVLDINLVTQTRCTVGCATLNEFAFELAFYISAECLNSSFPCHCIWFSFLRNERQLVSKVCCLTGQAGQRPEARQMFSLLHITQTTLSCGV